MVGVPGKAAGDPAVPLSLADLGRSLRRLRADAELSQRQIEDATKHGHVPLSRSQISRVENGDVLPGARWLDAYLAQCGVAVGSRAYRWWSTARRRLDRELVGRLPTSDLAAARDLRAGVPVDVPSDGEPAYAVLVRDMAPEQLLARGAELDEVARFCADDRAFLWWRAEPWAGKSALASWVVLHPPAGVTTVSFFITGRLRGQADSDAFTEALIDQLAAVAGERVPRVQSTAVLDRERRRLLGVAAARVRAQGQRLLLVVDGLDEDEGAHPASPLPSISALLPERPPAELKVMLTSRPHPGIPSDVPATHPMRRCEVRDLPPFASGGDLRHRAVYELNQRLHGGDQRHVDVIGFVTAAGGGLTIADLADLTGQPHFAVAAMLDGSLGRTLQRRVPPNGHRRDHDRAVLFAHDTLREIAEEQLARDLRDYWLRLDQWADSWRRRDWPSETPQYLLRPYGQIACGAGAGRRAGRVGYRWPPS